VKEHGARILMSSISATAIIMASVSIALVSDQSFPKPIASQFPTYPEAARNARIAGTVKVQFSVTLEGNVAEAEVVSGNPMLRDSALAAVKSWKFRQGSIEPKVPHATEFVYVLNVQQKSGEPKLTVSMKDFRKIEVTSERYIKPIE
jgi:TonB family protein